MDYVLDDITVVDASQGMAGPFTGRLLADFGADVYMLEPPGGKTPRNYANGRNLPDVSRQKRSIVLDLSEEDGTEALYRLIEKTDVFIHNNRPGVNERLGISYEKLAEKNPSLIYCSVNGYGESGPYKNRPGIAPLASALSGLMWKEFRLKSNECGSDIRPDRLLSSVAQGTGVYAAFGILAALRRAEQSGEGEHIEVSLFDVAASYMGSTYTEYDLRGELDFESRTSYAPSGGFETATGYLFLATPLPHLWERLCNAVEREDWLSDPRFETVEDRFANREELHAEMDEEFRQYERDELLSILLDAGVTAAEIQTVAEAIEDEHLHARNTIQRVEHVDGTETITTAPPIAFSGELPKIERDVPELGEHTEETLREIGMSDSEIQRLTDTGVISNE